MYNTATHCFCIVYIVTIKIIILLCLCAGLSGPFDRFRMHRKSSLPCVHREQNTYFIHSIFKQLYYNILGIPTTVHKILNLYYFLGLILLFKYCFRNYVRCFYNT